MLESLRLNTATLSLSIIWAGKLFQTLILRQTKEFRRQFILECSLNILKLWPLVRDVSQSMILKSWSHSILTKPRIIQNIIVKSNFKRKHLIQFVLPNSENRGQKIAHEIRVRKFVQSLVTPQTTLKTHLFGQ